MKYKDTLNRNRFQNDLELELADKDLSILSCKGKD